MHLNNAELTVYSELIRYYLRYQLNAPENFFPFYYSVSYFSVCEHS